MAKTKLDVKVVEIEKIHGVPELDASSASAVATLRDHPGFQYLVTSLRHQAALLKTALAKNRHKDIRDVEFLQSGINWCGWLEEQISKAVGLQNRPAPRPARASELDEFERLLNQIDVVGASQQATTPGMQ